MCKHSPCMMFKMKIERILWYVQLIEFSVFLSRFAGKVKIAQLCTFPIHTDNRKCTENKLKNRYWWDSHGQWHFHIELSFLWILLFLYLPLHRIKMKFAHILMFLMKFRSFMAFSFCLLFVRFLIFSRVVYDELIQLKWPISSLRMFRNHARLVCSNFTH